jgi:hypothetical protein
LNNSRAPPRAQRGPRYTLNWRGVFLQGAIRAGSSCVSGCCIQAFRKPAKFVRRTSPSGRSGFG